MGPEESLLRVWAFMIAGRYTYSDISDGEPGEGNISANPMFVDANGGDYHLQPSSPCIDAGANDVPALPETDFEGDSRIIDGDNDGTATVEMGADEYVSLIVRADIRIQPMVLNLESKRKAIICLIRLPEECDIRNIASDSLELSIPSCSGSEAINVSRGFPLRRRFLAFFPRQDLIDEIENMDLELPTKLDLKLNGELNDGTLFEGLDTIGVIERRWWIKENNYCPDEN
ncbi:hypothetical protein K8R14_01290 [bacterium]|nr:hypothetical protein [bacterium]